jgi:hypothetical protein
MTVKHPHADRDASPAAVTVGTTTYSVDSDGGIACPDSEADAVAERLAEVYGCDADDLLAVETCDVVKSDGEICGRDRPCPYHDEGA